MALITFLIEHKQNPYGGRPLLISTTLTMTSRPRIRRTIASVYTHIYIYPAVCRRRARRCLNLISPPLCVTPPLVQSRRYLFIYLSILVLLPWPPLYAHSLVYCPKAYKLSRVLKSNFPFFFFSTLTITAARDFVRQILF